MAAHPACPFCGSPVSSSARYCDHCGTPLSQPSSSTPPRRQSGSRRMAAWVFVLLILLTFAGGTVGGFRYKAGAWPLIQGEPASGPAPTPGPGPGPGPAVTPEPPSQQEKQAVAQYLRAVVSISAPGQRGNKSGSGFIINDLGHVVTASHVVEGATGCLTVYDDNGRVHQGLVVESDDRLDMALLYVPTLAKWPTALRFATNSLQTADAVWVLGSPKGVGHNVQPATVSNLGTSQAFEGRFYRNLIQVSGATVLEGTSGGPLIQKATGRVAGVVVVGGGAAAVAWAVPAGDVAGLVEQWAKKQVTLRCQSAAGITVPVVLATITPLSGSLGVFGSDLADGAQLALRDMEANLRAVGYEVTLRRYDDESSATRAAEVAATADYDPRVLGVVGSLDSSVTQAIGMALKPGGLALVAPTAGADDLTGFGWPHFNRLVARSARQQQALAQFAKDRLKVRSVFILEDGSAEAVGQMAAFESAAQVLGLQVAGKARVTAGAGLTDLRTRLTETRAEALLYAGTGGTAFPVIRTLRRDGVKLPVLGGEALSDYRFEEVEGQAIYFTRLTAEPSEQFRRRFEDVLGKPTRGYAAYGYDAASVILSALVTYGQTHPGQVPPRAELARLVRQTKGYLGWVSPVNFDQSGDNLTAWVYLYEWRQGVPQQHESMNQPPR